MTKTVFSTLIALLITAGSAFAQTDVMVHIENLQPEGGLFFTPVWVGFHDGTFDAFDVGGTASEALEIIAEGGDIGPLSASFAGQGVDGGVAPGSPFGPSGSSFASMASATFSVEPSSNGYFSYASMIIPSNDAFVGNDNPMAYSLFDADGNFSGPVVIEILGSSIYDAGTEVNSSTGGAAFSALGGDSMTEAMPIGMHAGLDEFIGTGTANGETIASAFAADSVIARITVSQAVPEPNSFLLLGLAIPAIGLLRKRRS